MSKKEIDPDRYIQNIIRSELTIYDKIEIGDEELWIPAEVLEYILNNSSLIGQSVATANRTRSKQVKQKICEVLGYPVPDSFKKTQPRFIGQNFDTYIQKSNNLQIWNEDISPSRRYVIVKVSEDYKISKVKVIRGEELAKLDNTGTLTKKYQAKLTEATFGIEEDTNQYLCDTEVLKKLVNHRFDIVELVKPNDYPDTDTLLSIKELYKKLKELEGTKIDYLGFDQERNRGAKLHRLICELLEYESYNDDGSFPDLMNQLLEVKLQTSPTIDLGLVSPSDKTPLDIPELNKKQIRHCDVRYAVVSGSVSEGKITLDKLYLTSGQNFYNLFPQMAGNIENTKIQIRLPNDFFIKTKDLPD